MLAFTINLHIVFLAAMLVLAFVVGFALRSSKIRACHKKIRDLEKELLNSDAQILELEKEKVDLIRQMKESKIPVIPLKSKGDENRKAR